MFDSSIKFKYNWRAYQAEILQDLNQHLEDRQLHFVAPPGAGKTVLGLELIRKLNKPTLVLAPNIGIRDQWKERFLETFVPEENLKYWDELISHEIESKSNFIIATYQSFYSKSKDPQTLHESIGHIQVIALDEAHHLQNSWMQALYAFKQEFKPISISLTATPPYDVSWEEWDAYNKINGPIDSEISLIDLVKTRSLCPHQDYIYHLTPTEEELIEIEKYRKLAEDEKSQLFHDFEFGKFYSSQKWILDPKGHELWILKNFNLYIATINYLVQHQSLNNKQDHEDILSLKLDEIIASTGADEELLIKNYITQTEHGHQLRTHYTRLGLMVGHHLKFDLNSARSRVLKKSFSRLRAIHDLTEKESLALGNELRLLILTSRIQAEVLDSPEDYQLQSNKVAVFPIFEHLRRNLSVQETPRKMAILTGSHTIIPKSCLLALEFIQDHFNWKDYIYDDQYIISRTPKKGVLAITKLIEAGEIEIIIGTQSLLGEGWDAPSINTLILASEISSFVSTNQMRGRAIRIDKTNLAKSSHIWHLGFTPKKKFNHFLGPHNHLENKSILTGLERFDTDNQNIDLWINQRQQLREHWDDCIAQGSSQVVSVIIPEPPVNSSFIGEFTFKKTQKKIAQVIWDTLLETKQVHPSNSKFEIICTNVKGRSKVFLKGISKQDEAVFLKCLEEVHYTNHYTNYLISIKPGWWDQMFFNPAAYLPEILSIPSVIAEDRHHAELFIKNFQYHLCPGTLISTKGSQGRRELIQRLYKNKTELSTLKLRETGWE